jgi:hypothetical protein
LIGAFFIKYLVLVAKLRLGNAVPEALASNMETKHAAGTRLINNCKEFHFHSSYNKKREWEEADINNTNPGIRIC